MKRKIKYVWVSARGSFEQAGSGEVDAYAATDHVESRHGFERCIEGAVRRLHLTGDDAAGNLGRFVIQAFEVPSARFLIA
jgi:hypothetical protein